MSRIYEIDFPKLVRLLMPPRLRKMRHVAWLLALCNPVNYLYQQFRRNRDANLYRLKITPQVVYLERLLNDRYDISQRRIKISDGMIYEPVFLYQEIEQKPVYLWQESENKPLYLYTEEEVGSNPVSFYVFTPRNLYFDENEMSALINNYKLAGKTYKIQRA
ncbi:hypothetical protein [Chitinophaga sp.]|uniref:hypothetical protein n=1 Tax=Chitinophaga sp. TaxID=1869181 RepID=UPI0031DB9F3E